MQIERYHLRTGPDGLSIKTSQTKPAFACLIVSLVLFGVVWYVAEASDDSSPLLGYGFFGLFVIVSIAGMLYRESFLFGPSEFSYGHSFRLRVRKFPRDEVVRIELVAERATASSSLSSNAPRTSVLVWSVRVVGEYESVAKFIFELDEASARKLAEEIARHWDLGVVELL